MIRRQQAVGESGRLFTDLGAVSTVNNLHVLRRLMLERRPQRTLEVGLSLGGSALVAAASHRDNGAAPARQHTSIDPNQAHDWDNAGLSALQRAGLRGYTDFRPFISAIALPALAAEAARFGLIYVDGSHLFDDVFIDAYYGFRLLEPGGVILFDDSSTDHVAKVLSFVCANWANWTEEIDLSGYRSDGGSLRYQVGKRLGKVQLRAFRRTGDDDRAWDAPLRSF